MGEMHYRGPLDVARDLQEQALRFDALAQTHLERRPDDLAALSETVHQLDYLHPWMGQEVAIYGIPLTVSIDDDIAIPYSLPAGLPKVSRQGVYNGLTIRNVYNPETDEQKHKVVHMLRTATTGPLLDAFGDTHKTDHYTYLCLQGSDGTPVLPYDAHSLKDLASDPVIAEVDEIMFAEESDVLLQVAMLGENINEALAHEDIDFEQVDLNHQRASYINSLGLHDRIRLAVNDLMIGPKGEPMTEFLFSSMDFRIDIKPYFFNIAPGYDRVTGRDVPLIGGASELYAQVATEDDQIVLAPLKSILDVKEIE